jgi:hypothetical protein
MGWADRPSSDTIKRKEERMRIRRSKTANRRIILSADNSLSLECYQFARRTALSDVLRSIGAAGGRKRKTLNRQ